MKYVIQVRLLDDHGGSSLLVEHVSPRLDVIVNEIRAQIEDCGSGDALDITIEVRA